jgi:hypothetical protein
MVNIEDQKRLFSLIGKNCERKIEALTIGGSAMLFYNFSKTETKDMDIVCLSENDRKYLLDVLYKIKFRKDIEPNKPGAPYRLILEERYILDIFAGSIFHIKISDAILGRIKEKVEFGNLTISVIAPEDIILTKCVTDRKGDREDAMGIIKASNVKWDVILHECQWQTDNGEKAFTVYLFDFLEDLKEMGADVPKDVLKKVRKMSEQEMLKVLKSDKGNVNIK